MCGTDQFSTTAALSRNRLGNAQHEDGQQKQCSSALRKDLTHIMATIYRLCYSVTAINILTRFLKMKWNRSVLNHCSALTQSPRQCNKPRSSGNMYSVVCMWIYDRVGQGVNSLQEQNILQFFNKWSRHNAMGQQHGPWISKLWAILVHKETVNNKSTRSRRIAKKKCWFDPLQWQITAHLFFLELHLLQVAFKEEIAAPWFMLSVSPPSWVAAPGEELTTSLRRPIEMTTHCAVISSTNSSRFR